MYVKFYVARPCICGRRQRVSSPYKFNVECFHQTKNYYYLELSSLSAMIFCVVEELCIELWRKCHTDAIEKESSVQARVRIEFHTHKHNYTVKVPKKESTR